MQIDPNVVTKLQTMSLTDNEEENTKIANGIQ